MSLPQRGIERLRAAARAVRARAPLEPGVALLLDGGAGALGDAIDVQAHVAYADIPGFPTTGVESPGGQLLLGRLNGTPVVAMRARPHPYEGFDPGEVAFPVRLMKLLGAEALVLAGPCGALHPRWSTGELVLLDDHLNLTGGNPLTGPNLDELGPRFPDMSEPYDRGLQAWAREAAQDRGVALRRGVYAAVAGPAPSTRAECRMLRTLGADVVGTSVVPDVITARHMGMRVMAIVVVSDARVPDSLAPAYPPAMARTAGQSGGSGLRLVLEDVLARGARAGRLRTAAAAT